MTFKQDEALNVNLVQSGKDGLSAYEVAVKNGYEGTEEEWLASLKPVKGKDYFTEADIAEIQDGVEVCKTFTYDATLTMDTATLTNTYTVDATTDISDLITWVNAGKPVKIDFNVDGTTKNVFTGILSNSTGAIANYNIGTINANNFAYQQLIIMEG
ncbi:MAG: hypothetical protein Q4B15_03345 [Lachnospiraceae bacterium]|nr:hypothetical protein [Lachnospiraceae bacterium]